MLYGTAFPGPFVQRGVPAQVPQTFLAPTQTFPAPTQTFLAPTQTVPFAQGAPWAVSQPFVQDFVPLGAEAEWDWDDEGEYLGIVGTNPFRRRRRRAFGRRFGKPFGKFGKHGKPFGKHGKPFGKYGKPFGKYGGYY